MSPDARLTPSVADALTDAKRRYVELYGSALVMNAYLRVLLAAALLIIGGLVLLHLRRQEQYAQLRPLVIRIDEVGRATAVSYDALSYRPQAPELKYFLMQFTVKHYSRMRATLKQTFAESLYFLEAARADAIVTDLQRTRALEQVLSGEAEEIEVQVHNVTLESLQERPLRASIDFERIFYAPGTTAERRRQRAVATVHLMLRDQVPHAAIPYNPLGLTIVYLREDVAFR